MRTKVGSTYSEEVIKEDIRNLVQAGMTNVRIFGEPQADGVKVMVVVQSKATVGAVEVQGATKVKAGSLTKQFATKPNEPLSEATIEQDRQKILDAYEKKNIT